MTSAGHRATVADDGDAARVIPSNAKNLAATSQGDNVKPIPGWTKILHFVQDDVKLRRRLVKFLSNMRYM
ncbi:hypothetical protein KDL45_18965 [bacterium]|nr:hypothetical protein [bacterium]